MEFLLLITYIGLNFLDFKRYKFYNTINITIGAYVVITLLNNFFVVQWGFYKIETEVQMVLFVAMVFIYISAFIRRHIRNHCIRANNSIIELDNERNKILNNEKRVRIVFFYFSLCCLARFIQIFLIFKKYGLEYLGENDFEQLNLSGIPSHMFLSIYPLSAFIFYYAIKKKRITPLILYVLGLIISFLSFVKYNAIFYVIFTFIFCTVMDKKLGRKLVILLGSAIIVIFVGNYFWGFFLRNTTGYKVSDYIIHLWDYIGGSMINGNHCIRFFDTNTGYSVVDLLITSFSPLFNLISSKLLNYSIEKPVFPMGLQVLSDFGNSSNVAGLIFNISYTGSVVFFITYCLGQGWIIEGIIKRLENKKYIEKSFFYSMVFTVSLMTFFANYFSLLTIWELLIWSYIIPKTLIFSRISFNRKK